MEVKLAMWVERHLPVFALYLFPESGGINGCFAAHVSSYR
jgi:hypothetical protein